MVHIEALFIGHATHTCMSHLFILEGNTIFSLVKWSLYVVY